MKIWPLRPGLGVLGPISGILRPRFGALVLTLGYRAKIGGSGTKILGYCAGSWCVGFKIWGSEAKIWCSRANFGGSRAKSQGSGATIGDSGAKIGILSPRLGSLGPIIGTLGPRLGTLGPNWGLSGQDQGLCVCVRGLWGQDWDSKARIGASGANIGAFRAKISGSGVMVGG